MEKARSNLTLDLTPAPKTSLPSIFTPGIPSLATPHMQQIERTIIDPTVKEEDFNKLTPDRLQMLLPDLKSPLIPVTVEKEIVSPNGIFHDNTNCNFISTSNQLNEKVFQAYHSDLGYHNGNQQKHCNDNDSSSEYTNLGQADQYKDKIERKRARNRIAASKCRRRKMERIQELEITVAEKQKEIDKLKQILAKHRQAGCSHNFCE